MTAKVAAIAVGELTKLSAAWERWLPASHYRCLGGLDQIASVAIQQPVLMQLTI